MIPYKAFSNAIKGIKNYNRKMDRLSDALEVEGIINDTTVGGFIDFMEAVFNDKSEWISYWIYELDYGRKYTEGSITIEENGVKRTVPLKTTKHLYKVLVDNMKEAE